MKTEKQSDFQNFIYETGDIMPYCMYLRKSRVDAELESLGDGNTLERHKTILLNFCKKSNIEISHIYREIVSGESIESRPEMQKLLKDVETGKWDGIVVTDIDRLARGDTVDQGIIIRALKLRNTKIITPHKTYDPSCDIDEEYLDFNLFFSRREYKTITRRIQRGRLQSAKEGKFLGSQPPYGYDKVKIQNGKGYTLAVNESEAETVLLIYDMYLGGSGMSVIAKALDEKGIKPRRNEKWSKSSIGDILKNPVYTGKIRWAYRKEEKEYRDGETVKKRVTADDCIFSDGLHQGIVPAEIFDAVQKIRNRTSQKKVKADASLKNPLSGIVFCGKCSSPMTRLGENSRTKYAALRCSNRYCDNISAPLFLVEREILSNITLWIKAMTVQCETAMKKSCGSVSEKSLRELEAEKEKTSAQLSRAFDLLEQGIYTPEIFQSRKNTLDKKSEELQDKISVLLHQLREQKSLSEFADSVLPKMRELLEAYENLPDAQSKNSVLRSLLIKATYLKTEKNKKGTGLNKNFTVEIFPKAPLQ